MEADPPQEPVLIPPAELSAQLLRSIAESFVLREGTDYGMREVSFEDKVTQVVRQIERGEAQILWNAATETVAIIPAAGAPRRAP